MYDSTDKRNYQSLGEYLGVLKYTFREKLKSLALAVRNGISGCGRRLEAWELWVKIWAAKYEFDLEAYPSVKGPTTYSLSVTEVGGQGGYYFLHGYHRKPGNTVHFKVTPPVGGAIISITAYGTPLDLTLGEYVFEMGHEDPHIVITYAPAATVFYYSSRWTESSCVQINAETTYTTWAYWERSSICTEVEAETVYTFSAHWRNPAVNLDSDLGVKTDEPTDNMAIYAVCTQVYNSIEDK